MSAERRRPRTLRVRGSARRKVRLAVREPERCSRLGRSRVHAFSFELLIAQLRDERVGLWESVAAENVEQARLRMANDYREGFAAFQQKREATFTGE